MILSAIFRRSDERSGDSAFILHGMSDQQAGWVDFGRDNCTYGGLFLEHGIRRLTTERGGKLEVTSVQLWVRSFDAPSVVKQFVAHGVPRTLLARGAAFRRPTTPPCQLLSRDVTYSLLSRLTLTLILHDSVRSCPVCRVLRTSFDSPRSRRKIAPLDPPRCTDKQNAYAESLTGSLSCSVAIYSADP